MWSGMISLQSREAEEASKSLTSMLMNSNNTWSSSFMSKKEKETKSSERKETTRYDPSSPRKNKDPFVG